MTAVRTQMEAAAARTRRRSRPKLPGSQRVLRRPLRAALDAVWRRPRGEQGAPGQGAALPPRPAHLPRLSRPPVPLDLLEKHLPIVQRPLVLSSCGSLYG